MTRNTIAQGDAFDLIRALPEAAIDCTVTSVPYWMQREYLPAGHRLAAREMGRERDPDEYVADLGHVFGLLYHKTAGHGVCWVNIGDKVADASTRKLAPSYRPGELLGLPWKFSQEMRLRGWRRIREVIWHKPDVNPRGTPDGPLIAHEHVFLFARGPAHYFDPIAISDPAKYPIPGETRPMLRGPRTVWEIPTARVNGAKILGTAAIREPCASCPVHGDQATFIEVACSCPSLPTGFFAAFPPRLAERCILSTTPEAGVCGACGRPWTRLVKKERVPTRPGRSVATDATGKARRDPFRHVTIAETVGWAPSCGCPGPPPAVPALVCDPFAGSGTTPMVASALGRDYYAIELNPATARLAVARLATPFTRSYRP